MHLQGQQMSKNGFTLVELLVTLAVGSVILLGVFLSINQILQGTDRSNSQNVALADVAQAARAIKRDLIVTQVTDLTDGGPAQGSVNLSWTDYSSFISENQTPHTAIYNLFGTFLNRTYDGTTSIVGRYITSINFSQSGNLISVVLTATGPDAARKSETLSFSGFIRSEAAE